VPLSTDELMILSAVLGAGCFVEAVAGFGGTILALALGARWFSIEALLAWFLPVNMLLSVTLAVRGRAAIERAMLARRILPSVGAGLVVGTALAWVIVADRARLAFALLVVGVAAWELYRQLRPSPSPSPSRELDAPSSARPEQGRAPARPVSKDAGGVSPTRWPERALLVGAGVAHGLFATGGPLAVAALARLMPTKAAMRATLAVLWLSLNLLVATRLVVRGDLDGDTLLGSAMLVPALLVGLVLGEHVHGLASERTFRRLVAGLLLLSAALVLARTLQ
jgi:uncharacterized membrane protein YfcA